jgi:hypothetical protein
MSGDRSKNAQPGLWDEAVPSTNSPEAPRRHQSQATRGNPHVVAR